MVLIILGWLLFGFVVGLVARALFPGRQPMGLLATAGLGMAGSLVGGLVGHALAGHLSLGFYTVGFVGSLLGALLILLVSRLVHGRAYA